MNEICKACGAMHDRHKNYCETCQLANGLTEENRNTEEYKEAEKRLQDAATQMIDYIMFGG